MLLAEPVSRPAARRDVLALSGLLCAGDVLLTVGNTRAAALVRSVTRSPWAHVSIYVGPLEAGDDPRCIVEADIAAGVRAVPLTQFKGQRARILFARLRARVRLALTITTRANHQHAVVRVSARELAELPVPPTPKS